MSNNVHMRETLTSPVYDIHNENKSKRKRRKDIQIKGLAIEIGFLLNMIIYLERPLHHILQNLDLFKFRDQII